MGLCIYNSIRVLIHPNSHTYRLKQFGTLRPSRFRVLWDYTPTVLSHLIMYTGALYYPMFSYVLWFSVAAGSIEWVPPPLLWCSGRSGLVSLAQQLCFPPAAPFVKNSGSTTCFLRGPRRRFRAISL
jgi:hypothetical protein